MAGEPVGVGRMDDGFDLGAVEAVLAELGRLVDDGAVVLQPVLARQDGLL